MPEEKISEIKENQEQPLDQVDEKTEQSFDLIRSHEERMKITQDFLDEKLKKFETVEVGKELLSYQAGKVCHLFQIWKKNPDSIDFSNPEDKKIYSNILLYVKMKNPQLVDVSLDDMQKAFQDLKQNYWEKKYKANTRDFKNKNPLSLKIPGKQYKHDGAYVVYKSFDDGRSAAYRMVDNRRNGKSSVYKPNYSLNQVNGKYASDPRWASRVALNLRVSPTTKIVNIPTDKLVAAISAVEDGVCYKLGVDEGYIPNLPGVK